MNKNAPDKKWTLDLANEKASERFGSQLAHCLSPNLVLALSGDVGTGKTTVVRALLRSLGIRCAVKSPTFSLVESYVCEKFTIHHFDLYRIAQAEELEYLGFRDYFSHQSICLIEWAEHAGKFLPKVDARFHLAVQGLGRRLTMNACSEMGKEILAKLAGEQ
jgi:tRNA threonylcarbamoyladenosine biosynthesis protein TsaE